MMNPLVLNAAVRTLESPKTSLRLQGELGRRVQANIDQWLIPAPLANPALINMIRVRNRNPATEQALPWSGEFVGKYLIGAVQAMHMSDDPRLRETVDHVVDDLLAAQAPNGYIGPFPASLELAVGWDVWGHYHAIMGLLDYYEATGRTDALAGAQKAADLVVATFLEAGRKICETDDRFASEMNHAIVHGLARLYRMTGKQSYLDMANQVVAEWECPGTGDYLRKALAEVEFYQQPKPRWESLHDLEGFYELYRVTGDERYKRALIFDWRSINRTDIHNNGSFSNGEGACGNPFRSGAIETCCTVAWMALSVDMLKLTADPAVADRLDLALWNAVLAYQHPSGRWCTYDTPMMGKREAGLRSIAFQSRAGSPELSCCSANAPRGLGMVSQWAALTEPGKIYWNFYGPGQITLEDADGTNWDVTLATQYPVDGAVCMDLSLSQPSARTLCLRIPAWAQGATVAVNGQAQTGVQAGAYLAIERTWQTGDVIEVQLGMPLHYLQGDQNVQGRTSVYRGPLLLAYDQRYNDYEAEQIPTLDADQMCLSLQTAQTRIKPMLLVEVEGQGGTPLRLCDFATAGAWGTYYQSWLPVSGLPPAGFALELPFSGQVLPNGRAVLFSWGAAAGDATYMLSVARDAAMTDVVATRTGLTDCRTLVEGLAPDQAYYWSVQASNEHGAATCGNGPMSFKFAAGLVAEGGVIIKAPLDGNGTPVQGSLRSEVNLAAECGHTGRAAGAVAFDGSTSKIVYDLPFFPQACYSLSVWLRPAGMSPQDAKGYQVACAWCKSFDDPLRLIMQGQQLYARIENGVGYSTAGVPLENDTWYHAAVVKDGPQLKLYVNGALVQTTTVPAILLTSAATLGVGCNPNYGGDEYFRGVLDDVSFYDRALTQAQIASLMANRQP